MISSFFCLKDNMLQFCLVKFHCPTLNGLSSADFQRKGVISLDIIQRNNTYLPSALISKRLKLRMSGWSQLKDLFVQFPYLIQFFYFLFEMAELEGFLYRLETGEIICSRVSAIFSKCNFFFFQVSFLNEKSQGDAVCGIGKKILSSFQCSPIFYLSLKRSRAMSCDVCGVTFRQDSMICVIGIMIESTPSRKQ